MPQNCCVPLCSNVKGGILFPRAEKSPERRQKWIVAIKRIDPNTKKLWEPSRYSVVCADHFLPTDFRETLLGERKILRRGVVPTLFPFKRRRSHEDEERDCRRLKRHRPEATVTSSSESSDYMVTPLQDQDIEYQPPAATASSSSSSPHSPPLDIAAECTIMEPTISSHSDINMEEDIHPSTSFTSTTSHLQTVSSFSQTEESHCSSSRINFTIDNFHSKPQVVKYYTGFSSYDHFMLLFNILGPCVYQLQIGDCHLHPKDQLFLTLIKLRQAKDDFELSILFDLRPNTVSVITHTWIKFLYFQLKEIDMCPSKETVTKTLPNGFRGKYESTRMIIDGTEIPIQKPRRVDAQSATFSTYKNRNTAKVLVGCSPRGVVSFVSDAYGGCVSDRQICERSELLHNPDMLDKGDSIMSDRGFNVQDLFAARDIKVNIPTFLKGKSQLSAEEVSKDRSIASKRIHVERLIGLAKTFKILKREVPAQRIVLSDYITSVCFMLVNFKETIISQYM